jgi:general secretion pathway protein D
MKHLVLGCLLFTLEIPATALGETPPGEAPSAAEVSGDTQTTGVSIVKVIDIVARKTGKKYVLDPRVHAQAQIIGEDLNRLTFPELLTILKMYGFTAVESGGYMLVVPETIVRAMPLPTQAGKEVYPDSQYVSAVIPVTAVPAASLVPILRPLLPQQGHLAAVVCGNSLLVVDTFANVRRIETLIKVLDTGDPYKPAKCEASTIKPQQ